jgi:transcriptional regulator with XRE-family HTH domain
MAPRPPNPNHPLVKARLRSGYQQKEVAKLVNVPANTLSRYERGDRIPSRSVLERLANLYGVTVEALYNADTVPRETAISGPIGDASTPRAILLDAAHQLSAMATAFIQQAARIPEAATPLDVGTTARGAIERVQELRAPQSPGARRKAR